MARSQRRVSTVAQLSPNPKNPRKISDAQLTALRQSLDSFGDLSSFVFNVQTGRLVSGHQRAKIFADGTIVIERRLAKPNAQRTVAEGYVEHLGERFKYREVQWDELTETLAMVAANRQGGEWAEPELKSIMEEVARSGADIALTGFSEEECQSIIKDAKPVEPQGSHGDLRHISVTEEQLKIIEQAAEKLRASEEDSKMSVGRCMELIAADFLAGA